MSWLAASGLGGRSLTLAASMAAHAAVAIVAVGGGHSSRAATVTPGPAVEIAIDVAPAPAETPRENVAATAPSEPRAHSHSHTHPYPVPPDHDAHPHDPSLVHVPNAPPPSAPSAADVAPQAVATEAPVARFTLAIAPGAVTFGPVAANGGAHDHARDDHDEALATLPASSVTVPARRLEAPLGAYPEAARRAGVEGDVAVEIVVDARGAVVDARPVRHVGYGLDEAAVATVRRWRFAPAQKDGRVVRVRMTCDVAFRFE